MDESLIEDRCTGHCCKCFWLPWDYDVFKQKAESGELQDELRIFSMLIPLNLSIHPPGVSDIYADQPITSGAYYSCKHLLPSGDCAIYDERPKMCSEYPYYHSGGKCHYADCTWNRVRP